MVKTNKVTKLLMVTGIVGTMALGSMASVFAGVSPATTKVMLKADDSAVTSLDVTISEKVDVTAQAGTVDATVTDFQVTNNGTIGVANVEDLQLTGHDGWTAVAFDTDFAKESVNSKKFGLEMQEGNKDLTQPSNVVGMVNPQETKTVQMNAKVAPVGEVQNDVQIGVLTPTISMK